ncbi:uncharacterized protein LOC113363822 [Ctenocephalides felis]|uniref:uncharacterized protein LOC113363822 n=1 Tax=Ctenocephalides felis TaxID=7515 RepID=UPI000E6E157F|nr:uncharacterized protein LOC113363822 [Ctenocephalides felis]
MVSSARRRSKQEKGRCKLNRIQQKSVYKVVVKVNPKWPNEWSPEPEEWSFAGSRTFATAHTRPSTKGPSSKSGTTLHLLHLLLLLSKGTREIMVLRRNKKNDNRVKRIG